jgi:energy-coupling factor transporter ATP-binding protein EcfA2
MLDEPMAGLGAEGSRDMTALTTICCKTSRRNAPILLVEHDMDAVFQLADRISGAGLAGAIDRERKRPTRSAMTRQLCATPIWARSTRHEPC